MVQRVPQKKEKQRTVQGRRRTNTLKRRYFKKSRLKPKPIKRSVVKQQLQFPENQGSYEQGYQEGVVAAGELLLADHIPNDVIIPDLSASEAVAAGVQVLRKRGIPLLDPASVYEELNSALREKRPYAFIRLGDGELLTLAQDKLLTYEEVKRAGAFLPYSGVNVPDLAARDELASSIRVASLVGVPMSRHPHFQPLFFAALRAHGIDHQALKLTTSTMNYSLYELGLLMQLLKDRKTLVIGNVAEQLKQVLVEKGVEVAGVITPVRGYSDVGRVVAEAAAYEFDIALVAAGIAAIPIAVHLAGIRGKVTFDFGHLANRMAGLEHFERV
ncbi:GT-D fold domain-containing glycosyltransferase [Cohnella sp.]|uniref:GT-D fold domain-containing protein n=1 Tax=Cohnella sp. TaxID=1883426 RepID=UPI0035695D1D